MLTTTGFRKTTVSALARAAGISKGAFYLYFASKEALWVELLEDAEREMRDTLTELVASGEAAPEQRLRSVLESLFDAVLVHPLLRALADPDDMAWLLRALPPDTLAAALVGDDVFFGHLFDQLRAQGAIAHDDARAAFLTLPRAALALAQGRPLLGPEFEEFKSFQIDAWALRFSRG